MLVEGKDSDLRVNHMSFWFSLRLTPCTLLSFAVTRHGHVFMGETHASDCIS